MLSQLKWCTVTLVWLIASAILFPPTALRSDDLTTALYPDLMKKGIQHETEHRWQEAIQVYEKAQRRFPQQTDTQRRLQIVRIHYDVNRRYADKSYRQTVQQQSPVVATDLMGEILNKLQVYYVEPIELSRLIRNGTAFLEVALQEEEFIAANIPSSVPRESIEYFRANIHKSVLSQPVTNIAEAKSIVSGVATSARDQLGIAPTAVIYEYISGFVGLLDPYSAYLTPGEYQEIMGQIEGNLIGLGVELWAEGEDLKIVDVFKQGPAFEAGLRKGDRLLEVAGFRVVDIGAKKAADLLRGSENSVVQLLARRGEASPQRIDVQRRRVDVPSVNSITMVEEQDGTGYIRISNFQKTTPREVDEAMRSLYKQGMKQLIIDLRRNPGGLLDASVEIADMFLPQGSIVTTRGRNGQENHNYAAQMQGTWDVPITVIIDEDSASASEIFAGAIHDHSRGLIVGRTSYGKGSVQGVFHNDQGNGGMRLTVSKFYSPSGTAISARGIQPNLVFEERLANENRSAAKLPVSIDSERPATPIRPATSSSEEVELDWKSDSDILRAIETIHANLPVTKQ